MSQLANGDSVEPPNPEAVRGSGQAWKIALISATILILELTFIRQVPAEVRSISYFTNLILMSSFLGLGLGCILQNWRSHAGLLPAGLALLFGFTLLSRGIVIYAESISVHYWLEPPFVPKQAIQMPLLLSAMLAFVFSALPFVALGQALARQMETQPRLLAYSWDIAGSLAGTLLFSLSSYLHVPPWLWPPVVMLAWAAFMQADWRERLTACVAGLIFLCFANTPFNWHWSPYYLVQYTLMDDGIVVWVNSTFLQHGLDFKSTQPEVRKSNRHMFEKFSRPYEIYREQHAGRSPKSVLILGAGTGNDVNVALGNGAERVVAVEIDGTILDLGFEFNTSNPYQDSRVEAHVDDARHFFTSTKEKFDLVVFGTLDSVALLSGVANLRLENYAYTVEALGDVRELLNDDGMVSLYYSVLKPWLYARIYSTFERVFGPHIRMVFFDTDYLFNTLVMGAKNSPGFVDTQENLEKYGHDLPLTDDWPYLFLQEPTVAPVYQYLFMFLAVLLGGAFVVLRSVHRSTGWHLDFLFLGLGFTLMESAAIVRLALLFGSTWVTNAVVFAGVLLTIFLANLLCLKGRAPRAALAWSALFGMILLNYFFPVHSLTGVHVSLRVAGSILLIGLPVFCAAICFSTLFAREAVTGYALGVNLIGAMSGGVVEYLSMAIGMRAIWLIVLGVYGMALLCSIYKARVSGAFSS